MSSAVLLSDDISISTAVSPTNSLGQSILRTSKTLAMLAMTVVLVGHAYQMYGESNLDCITTAMCKSDEILSFHIILKAALL